VVGLGQLEGRLGWFGEVAFELLFLARPAAEGRQVAPLTPSYSASVRTFSPSAAAPQARITAFDWLRGLAVLVMIQCHALVLLQPRLRAGPLFRGLNFIDGLVAPSFILAAGFSLALTQVRGAAAGTRQARLLKTLRRIAEVLIVASLVNWMWFPILHEPRWLLRIDILHCIGLALLIALPIMSALASRPRLLRWVALGLAAIAFGAAPLAEGVKGPLASLVNISTGSLFPLLPWAGYVYLGASAGAVAASGDRRALVRWVLGLMAIGIAVWQATPLFLRLYPPHVFWITDPANHAHRWVIVCALVLVLMLVEQLATAGWRRAVPFRFVEVFGTSSLAAYFFHQALLYYEDFGFSFNKWWGERCGWGKYAALTAALIGATFVLVSITDRVYGWVNSALASRGSIEAKPKLSEGH